MLFVYLGSSEEIRQICLYRFMEKRRNAHIEVMCFLCYVEIVLCCVLVAMEEVWMTELQIRGDTA